MKYVPLRFNSKISLVSILWKMHVPRTDFDLTPIAALDMSIVNSQVFEYVIITTQTHTLFP